MRPLWMGIVPGPVMTRVLLLDGPHTLLQARLPHGCVAHDAVPGEPAPGEGLGEFGDIRALIRRTVAR